MTLIPHFRIERDLWSRRNNTTKVNTVLLTHPAITTPEIHKRMMCLVTITRRSLDHAQGLLLRTNGSTPVRRDEGRRNYKDISRKPKTSLITHKLKINLNVTQPNYLIPKKKKSKEISLHTFTTCHPVLLSPSIVRRYHHSG